MKKIAKGLGYTLLLLLVLVMGVLFTHYHGDLSVDTLKEKYTYPDSKFVEIEGMNVHYRVTGEGPTLLLIHGTGASLHTWEEWTEILSPDFQIISVDMPAFGLTGMHPKNDQSIAMYTDFLKQFLDKIEVPKCHIAGNSLGGRIAWGFTLAHPEMIDKLVLIDAAAYPVNKEEPLAFRLAKNPITSSLLTKITPKSLFKKSLLDVYGNDDLVSDDLINRYFELYLREGNRAAFVARVKHEYKDQTANIKNIQAPTLILWGKEDSWIPVQHAIRFNKEIVNSKLIIYDNAGHVPMEEIPQETALDTKAFLLQNNIEKERLTIIDELAPNE